MKTIYKIFALIFALISTIGANAQSVDNYTLTRVAPASTYASIIGNGGIAITTNSSASVKFLNTGNSRRRQNRSNAIALGFEFVYNGIAYTAVRVSSDGFLDFNFSSNSTLTSDNGSITSSTSTFKPVIAALWDDLELDDVSTSSSNVYYYSDAANKLFTIEWTNIENNQNNNSNDNLNFQVVLNGVTGEISFNYGTMYAANLSNWSYSIGLADFTTTTTRNATTVKLLATANSTTTNTFTTNLSTLPSSNSSLFFTPPTILTAATIASIAPSLTTATVNWNAAQTSSATPFKYQVMYKNSMTTTWLTENVTGATSFQIQNLDPATSYDVKVVTWTEGSYQESAMSTFSTQALTNPSVNDSISFSNYTVASIDLTWTNFASGATYTVLYSTNANSGFTSFGTTTLNTLSVSGLTVNTTYYFQITATAGSTTTTALTGTAATDSYSGVVKTSEKNMDWTQSVDWNSNGVPTSANTVIIAHDVNLNTTATVAELIINSGKTLVLESNRTLTVNNDVIINGILDFEGGSLVVNGNLVINASGSIVFPNNSGTNGTLTVKGDITNAGSMDIRRSSTNHARLNLTGTSNQLLQGSGTFDIQAITVNKQGGNGANQVNMIATDFTNRALDLSITAGELMYNSQGTTNFAFNTMAISANAIFTMNSPNATTTLATTMTGGGIIKLVNGTMNSGVNSFNYTGELKIEGGICNIGTGRDDDLLFNNNSALVVNGGELNVYGQLRGNNTSNAFSYSQTAGTVTLGINTGNSTNYYALFLTNANKSFNMTNGTLYIQNTNSQGEAIDLSGCSAATSSVTGGTISFGNASTSNNQTFILNNATSPVALFNITVPTTNAILSINQDLQMNDFSCVGTFNTNSKNLQVSGDWNVSGTFNSGTNTTTFNGSNNQNINMATGSFNHLNASNNNVVTLLTNIDATGNVTIDANTTFELDETTFTVGGNLTNNGVLHAASANLQFNGTTAQVFNSVSNVECLNATVSNTNGLTLAANSNELQLIGTLTLGAAANLSTNGKLTLLEDVDFSGRVAELAANSSINGPVKVEKCLQGNIGYTGIGSVHTAIDFEQWDNDLLTTGIAGSDYPTYNFNSIYAYNESVAGTMDNGYYAPTSMTDTMQYKKGYMVYVYPQTVGAYGNCYVKLTTVGALVQQDVNFDLTYTSTTNQANDGWNLINNCYPSTVDWQSTTGWTKNGVTSINVYDRNANNGLGQYKQYSSASGQGTNGGSRYIPSGQAFWVKATNATASLVMHESAKVADFVAISREEVSSKLSLTLMNTQHHTDEVVAYVNNQASKGYDVDFDTEDMENVGVPSMYFPLNDSTHLAIYGSSFTENDTIPMFVKNPVSGQLRIESRNFYAPNTFACLTLFDSFTNTSIDLNRPNAVYSFYYSDTTTIARFFIYVRLRDKIEATMATCKGASNGAISVASADNNLKHFTWTDANGIVLKCDNNAASSQLSNIAAGVYTLHIADNSFCGGYDTTIIITEPSTEVLAQFSLSASAVEITEGEVAEIAVKNTSKDADSYTWLVNNELTETSDAPTFTFTEAGVYTIELLAMSNGCSNSTSKNVSVSMIDATNTSVESVNQTATKVLTTANGYKITSDVIDFTAATIKLMDMNGKTVQQNVVKSQHQVELNCEGLSSGVYMLQIQQNTGDVLNIKLVASH